MNEPPICWFDEKPPLCLFDEKAPVWIAVSMKSHLTLWAKQTVHHLQTKNFYKIFHKTKSECWSRESLLKGKNQYNWPPCTYKFRLAVFNTICLCVWVFFFFFTQQANLRRRSTVLILSRSVRIPWLESFGKTTNGSSTYFAKKSRLANSKTEWRHDILPTRHFVKWQQSLSVRE
jgi:hypothetical protein